MRVVSNEYIDSHFKLSIDESRIDAYKLKYKKNIKKLYKEYLVTIEDEADNFEKKIMKSRGIVEIAAFHLKSVQETKSLVEKFVHFSSLVETIEFSISQAFLEKELQTTEVTKTILYYTIFKNKEAFLTPEDRPPLVCDLVLVNTFLGPILELVKSEKFSLFEETLMDFYKKRTTFMF